MPMMLEVIAPGIGFQNSAVRMRVTHSRSWSRLRRKKELIQRHLCTSTRRTGAVVYDDRIANSAIGMVAMPSLFSLHRVPLARDGPYIFDMQR